MEISYFKAMSLVKSLSVDLSEAAEDNRITATEGMEIIRKVCAELEIEFDEEN